MFLSMNAKGSVRELRYNNHMTEDAQETLIDTLTANGFIDSESFEELAAEMLKTNHNYSEESLNDMSVYDLIDAVGDIFMMRLEEDADMNVCVVEYINN